MYITFMEQINCLALPCFLLSTVSTLLLLYNYIIILLFVPRLDVFDNYMQQDAHEFFNYLLNTIGDLLQGT